MLVPGVALNYKESRSLLSTADTDADTDGVRILLSWLQTLETQNRKTTATTPTAASMRPLDLVTDMWKKYVFVLYDVSTSRSMFMFMYMFLFYMMYRLHDLCLCLCICLYLLLYAH